MTKREKIGIVIIGALFAVTAWAVVISLVFGTVLVIGMSFCSGSGSEEISFRGSFVSSSGETIQVETSTVNININPKNFMTLTDSAGKTVTFRVSAPDAVPLDYYSEDFGGDESAAWVLESSGEELIACRAPDDRGQHKLLTFGGGWTDSRLNRLKPYVGTLEKSGFIERLPKAADRSEWREFFEKVRASGQETDRAS